MFKEKEWVEVKATHWVSRHSPAGPSRAQRLCLKFLVTASLTALAQPSVIGGRPPGTRISSTLRIVKDKSSADSFKLTHPCGVEDGWVISILPKLAPYLALPRSRQKKKKTKSKYQPPRQPQLSLHSDDFRFQSCFLTSQRSHQIRPAYFLWPCNNNTSMGLFLSFSDWPRFSESLHPCLLHASFAGLSYMNWRAQISLSP